MGNHKLHIQEQYSRRECLEIVGIPQDISDDALEDKVCQILTKIGVILESDDIQACHRLRKKDRTIIKLSNRKKCLSILVNRKKLKDLDRPALNFSRSTKIFVNESLCPYYRGVWGKCKGLLDDGLIHSLWTYNGCVKIKVGESDSAFSVTYDTDLYGLFPDRSFTRR